MGSEPLLDVRGLGSGYATGGRVLSDITFSIGDGDALALLGRNGVGKTTLLLTLMGHLVAREGTITVRGRELAAAPAHRRVAAGLGWVPQEREIFPSLTVDEHLTIARRPGAWTRDRVYTLFPRLRERRGNLGSQLSGGEQQMLAIARALVTNPSVLFLDEPLEGLAPVVVAEVASCIRALMEQERIAVIIVEQHAAFALELTQHAIVLDRGRIVDARPSAELRADQVLLDQLIGMRRLHPEGGEPLREFPS